MSTILSQSEIDELLNALNTEDTRNHLLDMSPSYALLYNRLVELNASIGTLQSERDDVRRAIKILEEHL